jgi:hypothetical protein
MLIAPSAKATSSNSETCYCSALVTRNDRHTTPFRRRHCREAGSVRRGDLRTATPLDRRDVAGLFNASSITLAHDASRLTCLRDSLVGVGSGRGTCIETAPAVPATLAPAYADEAASSHPHYAETDRPAWAGQE